MSTVGSESENCPRIPVRLLPVDHKLSRLPVKSLPRSPAEGEQRESACSRILKFPNIGFKIVSLTEGDTFMDEETCIGR